MHSRPIVWLPLLACLITIPIAGPIGAQYPAPGLFPAEDLEAAEAARAFAELIERGPYPAIEEPQPESAAAGREAQIEAAIRQYKDTGDASTLKRSDVTIFPFDESQPVVKCSPLRACDVELQAGEIVTGVALGDAERWIAVPLKSGNPDQPTPHIIVKPREYDAATNLVVGTTSRTYHLGLISPPKEAVESGTLAYHRHISFYYPAEAVDEWNRIEELEAAERRRNEVPALVALGALDLSALNFSYTVKADRKATWSPTTLFDDGRHVYLEFPRSALAGDQPALLVESATGELGVTNYRVNGRWMVVDGLFRRGRLVVGVGKKQRKVEIVNDALRGRPAS